MNSVQIALVMEIVGFVLASVSVLLKIGKIKTWADKLKVNIVTVNKKINETVPKLDGTLRGKLIDKNKKPSSKGALFFFALMVSIFIPFKRNLVIKGNLSRLMVCVMVWRQFGYILSRLLYLGILNIIAFFAARLVGHNAIKNLCIFIGTSLVLIGLIIELVATF